MAFDSIPSVGEATGVGALLTSVGGFFFLWRDRIAARARMDAQAETNKADLEKAEARVDSLEKELRDHKLDIAKRYVDSDTLRQVEARLFAAIDGVTSAIRDLGARIDRAIEQRGRD